MIIWGSKGTALGKSGRCPGEAACRFAKLALIKIGIMNELIQKNATLVCLPIRIRFADEGGLCTLQIEVIRGHSEAHSACL